MSHRNKRFLPLFLIMMLLLMQACSPGKKLFKKTDPYQRIQLVLDQHTSFDRLESKVNINFKNNQGSNSLSAQVKIHKDSCLWLSIQPFLGIELGRLLLTRDSLFLMNRLQKTYVTLALADQNIGNDQALYALKALTSALSNQFFVPGKQTVDAKDFVLQEVDRELVLSSTYLNEKASFYINAAGEYHQALLQSDMLDVPIEIEYSRFQNTAFGSFPSRVLLSFQQGNQQTECRVDYVKPVYNTQLSFDFPLPSNYKASSLESFLQQLQF